MVGGTSQDFSHDTEVCNGLHAWDSGDTIRNEKGKEGL